MVRRETNWEIQANTIPVTTPLQKSTILAGMGCFVALVALTASLPIPIHGKTKPLPSQGDDDATSTIVVGDTAWVLVATIFATLLSPVIGYLYGNLYGRTTSFSTQTSLLVAAMITTIWIVITFSLVYAKDANGDQMLGYPKYYYMFANVGSEPNPSYAPTIPFSLFAIFELCFALVSATLLVSSVLDRVNLYGLLAFMLFWHVGVYTPVAHIVWHYRGFLHTNNVEDFSGGIVVHMTAGISALGVHAFLNWMKAPTLDPRPAHRQSWMLFALFMVYLGSFGLNSGKSYEARTDAVQSIVNTIASVSVSVLITFFLDQLVSIPFKNVSLVHGVMLGLVASAPCSGLVSVGGAMVVSSITTLVTRIIARYIEGVTFPDQPYSIVTLHGVGGSVAMIFTPLVSMAYLNPGRAYNGLINGNPTPIRFHAAALCCLWVGIFLGSMLAAFFSNVIVPLSKDKQSGRGDYAPTPLGPFAFKENANKQESLYKVKSFFNIDAVN